MERLIFLKPSKTIDFSIGTDEDSYEPGDKVGLTVTVNEEAAVNETFYASITVTDYSSFLEVDKHKMMPSLPAMVYLEKEIQTINGKIDEFYYSDEYIDNFFNKNFENSGDKDYDRNVDLLLGMQNWRKGLLNDIDKL